MDRLRASEIFNDSSRMLIAVESIDVQQIKTNANYWLHGNIVTTAIIVCDADEIYALDMDATIIDVEQLRQGIPELDAIIVSFNKHKI